MPDSASFYPPIWSRFSLCCDSRIEEEKTDHFLPFFDFCKNADFSSVFKGFRLSLIPSIAHQKEPQANFSPVVPFLLVSRWSNRTPQRGRPPPLREFASPAKPRGARTPAASVGILPLRGKFSLFYASVARVRFPSSTPSVLKNPPHSKNKPGSSNDWRALCFFLNLLLFRSYFLCLNKCA